MLAAARAVRPLSSMLGRLPAVRLMCVEAAPAQPDKHHSAAAAPKTEKLWTKSKPKSEWRRRPGESTTDKQQGQPNSSSKRAVGSQRKGNNSKQQPARTPIAEGAAFTRGQKVWTKSQTPVDAPTPASTRSQPAAPAPAAVLPENAAAVISSAHAAGEAEEVLRAYAVAKDAKVRLSLTEYSSVLWACATTSSTASVNASGEPSFYTKRHGHEAAVTEKQAPSNRVYVKRVPAPAGAPPASSQAWLGSSGFSNPDRAMQALDIYKTLKQEHTLPPEAFQLVMAVAARCGSALVATAVLHDYEVMKYRRTSALLGDYVVAVAKFLRRASNMGGVGGPVGSGGTWSKERTLEKELHATYNEYVRLLQEEDQEQEQEQEQQEDEGEGEGAVAVTRGNRDVFMHMARTFSHLGRSEVVVDTLRHIVEVGGFAPPLSFCNELLEQALLEADLKTLQVLSRWYVDNFHDYSTTTMSHGSIIKMLHVACGGSNAVVAGNALALLRKCGHEVTAANYAAWVRAAVAQNDLPVVVEALLEAQNRGVDLAQHPASVDFFALQDQLSSVLAQSLRTLDEMYYAMVELVKLDHAVPPMAMNAVIAASGMLGQLDRSFATMQEYTELFNLTPDVHTYNALLCAVARSSDRAGMMRTILLLLEKMEAQGARPDHTSYSLLLEAMVTSGNFSGLEPILGHIQATDEDRRQAAAAAEDACTSTDGLEPESGSEEHDEGTGSDCREGNSRSAPTTRGLTPTQHSLRRLLVALAASPEHHEKQSLVLPLLRHPLPSFLTRRLEYLAQKRLRNQSQEHPEVTESSSS